MYDPEEARRRILSKYREARERLERVAALWEEARKRLRSRRQ